MSVSCQTFGWGLTWGHGLESLAMLFFCAVQSHLFKSPLLFLLQPHKRSWFHVLIIVLSQPQHIWLCSHRQNTFPFCSDLTDWQFILLSFVFAPKSAGVDGNSWRCWKQHSPAKCWGGQPCVDYDRLIRTGIWTLKGLLQATDGQFIGSLSLERHDEMAAETCCVPWWLGEPEGGPKPTFKKLERTWRGRVIPPAWRT